MRRTETFADMNEEEGRSRRKSWPGKARGAGPAACLKDKGVEGVSLSREVGRCWSGAGLDRLPRGIVKSLTVILRAVGKPLWAF